MTDDHVLDPLPDWPGTDRQRRRGDPPLRQGQAGRVRVSTRLGISVDSGRRERRCLTAVSDRRQASALHPGALGSGQCRSHMSPGGVEPMAGSQRDLTPLAPLGQARVRSGPVRAQRPVYVDLLPPCNAACPAGENIQVGSRLAQAAVRGSLEVVPTTTRSRRSTAGSATTRAKRPATGRARRGSVDPRRRALSRRPRHRAGLDFASPRPHRASGCWWSAPARPACPPRTSWPGCGHEVEIRDSGPSPAA